MRTFEENAMMQDMNLQEMKNVNGGIVAELLWLAAGLFVSELLDRNAGKDFMDGWNAGKGK